MMFPRPSIPLSLQSPFSSLFSNFLIFELLLLNSYIYQVGVGSKATVRNFLLFQEWCFLSVRLQGSTSSSRFLSLPTPFLFTGLVPGRLCHPFTTIHWSEIATSSYNGADSSLFCKEFSSKGWCRGGGTWECSSVRSPGPCSL